MGPNLRIEPNLRMESKLTISDMDLIREHSGVKKPPKWIGQFLKHKYFTDCSHHNHKSKNEREQNFFCTTCEKGPLCDTDRRGEHLGHKLVQVRKASRADAVKVKDLDALGVNSDFIQTYSINKDKIVFLPTRPQGKVTAGAAGHCTVCNRGLIDHCFQFCSLSCKLNSGKNENLPESQQTPDSPISVLTVAASDSESGESARDSLRQKKRKGSPHRAPFW